MGKGDHNTSNTGSAPHGDTDPISTVRSRHFSSNGIASPPGLSTVQLRKHRCPNGFSIAWFSRSRKYSVSEKKDAKDMPLPWQLRSSMVLVILLLTNLINYMDRYTIAGLLNC